MAMPGDKQPTSFLYLPYDVRVQIYGYLLTRQQQILIHYCESNDNPTITPSLLQTCKLVHYEASPILYRGNTFLVKYPKPFLDWLNTIGPENARSLKRLRIFVHAVYYSLDHPPLFQSSSSEWFSSELWYRLLSTLACRATGLRYLYVYWDARESCGHYGAGKDLRFVRELASIQGLDEMEIGGFFAKRWPEYLQQKVGKPVWDEQSTSQQSLKLLRQYQRDTEDLIP